MPTMGNAYACRRGGGLLDEQRGPGFFRRRSGADFVFMLLALASSPARRRGVPFDWLNWTPACIAVR